MSLFENLHATTDVAQILYFFLYKKIHWCSSFISFIESFILLSLTKWSWVPQNLQVVVITIELMFWNSQAKRRMIIRRHCFKRQAQCEKFHGMSVPKAVVLYDRKMSRLCCLGRNTFKIAVVSFVATPMPLTFSFQINIVLHIVVQNELKKIVLLSLSIWNLCNDQLCSNGVFFFKSKIINLKRKTISFIANFTFFFIGRTTLQLNAITLWWGSFDSRNFEVFWNCKVKCACNIAEEFIELKRYFIDCNEKYWLFHHTYDTNDIFTWVSKWRHTFNLKHYADVSSLK